MALPLAPVFPGHALTGPSPARQSSSLGRCCIGLDALESASPVENRPGDAGELVGERNRQDVAVQALLGRLDPRPEPIALPSLWRDLDQYDPGGLNEQPAQIAIAAPRYAAEDGAIAGRHLLGYQSKPGSEVAAFRKRIAAADSRHDRAREDRADAGHRHQSLATFVLTRQCCDLVGEVLNALIQPAPVSC